MKRLIFNDLIQWKNSTGRKPLVIQGARQVGKTWLMKELGEKHYNEFAYINFEVNPRLQKVFEPDLDIDRILRVIEIETGKKLNESTLLIFDEIQEAPKGLTALKYFYENAPQFHVVAAGSLLGTSIQAGNTFPVGKVDFLSLYPMSFEEFLINTNEQLLAEAIAQKQTGIIEPFHEKLISLLRLYYFVGGMPEAMNEYLKSKDMSTVRAIQYNILMGYENDFAKHAPVKIVPKIRMVWQAVLGQLAKKNRKLIYGQINKSARAKDFEESINWLVNAGLVLKCHRVSKPEIPLKTYADFDAFKLFLLDVGLLNAVAGVGEQTILDGNKILTEYKGAMTEQFVAQQLKHQYDLFYWNKENALAEVDFLIQKNDKIIPIEVKAEENLKARSLRVYYEKYHPSTTIRTSMSFYREQDWMENIPLYACHTI